MNDKKKAALSSYAEYGVKSEIEYADPHRLVQMLFDGALKRINLARAAMKAKQIEKKGILIGEAINIVGGLKTALDVEKGGEIAVNLNALYEYVENRLFMANATNSIGMLDETHELLLNVKEGWDGINKPEGASDEVVAKIAAAASVAEERQAEEARMAGKPVNTRSSRALKAYSL